MENVLHFLGADLSKKSIDLVCHQIKSHLKIENEITGFKQMLKWIHQLKIDPSKMMLVMEHTGLYSFCFEDFLHRQGIVFCKVNSLEIKRSMGLIRGKSDKIDAARIAEYGYTKRDKLMPDRGVSKVLQRLKMLNTSRELLVRQRTGLKCGIKEFQNIGIPEKDLVLQSQIQVLKALDKQIGKLENEIKRLIDQEETLTKNFNLLNSIIGVGPVVAVAAIIKTQNFSRFENARKFACYCGTAPFEHTSGTTIRGKTRVSHLADKRMKSLLDLAAKSAINSDKELMAFYRRRLELGKGKTSTINIIRNKIIYRMFAVIKRQTPFVSDYLRAA